jgi:hypothetical protein
MKGLFDPASSCHIASYATRGYMSSSRRPQPSSQQAGCAGLLVGPSVTGLLSRDMLIASNAVEGIAVALIAFTAGGEIRVDWVRREARRVALITLAELFVVAAGVVTVVMLTRSFLPFVPSDDLMKAFVIAMVFGAIAVANSPTVTTAGGTTS